MGFYGDIANTARTQFQFDRIYANRVEMETYKDTDGIYAGRFVLVEYDNEMHLDSFLRVFKHKDGNFYVNRLDDDNKTSQEVLLTKGQIAFGEVVYESAYEIAPDNGYYMKNCTFYKCTSNYVADSKDPATFIDIVGEGEDNPHVTNYTIDNNRYGRGYDSTVWQKVYDGGIEKYMMVAELNTVIPTFDLASEAPTQTPVLPHFDVQSSDIYYKLHHQPAWGFRVKSAEVEVGPQFDKKGNKIENSNINYTNSYPASGYNSDEGIVWTRTEYDPDTGKTKTLYWHSGNSKYGPGVGSWKETEPTKKMPGAIYYNKDGFNPEVIHKSDLDDSILVENSGLSGHRYSSHNKVGQEEAYPDIQELSMMLPSIGNSISAVWDLVYGDESMSTEETKEGQKKRNLDIDWDSIKGLRLVADSDNGYAYNTKEVSTIAGAINSVHDLMGMIIVNPTGVAMNKEFAATAESDKIYYFNGKYYHRVNDYEYDEENAIVGQDQTLSKEFFDEFNYKKLDYEFRPFPVGSFYYGTAGESYRVENNDYPTFGRTYYTTTNETIPFFKEVQPVEFDANIHYKFVNGYYTRKEDTIPIEGTKYYEILDENMQLVDRNLTPYTKNTYYIYNAFGHVGEAIPDEGDIELKDIIISSDGYQEGYVYYLASIVEGELYLEKADVFGVTEEHYCKDKIEQRYYKCGKDYIPNQKEVFNNKSRYDFIYIKDEDIKYVEYCYMPNKFYNYTDESNEYKINKKEKLDTKLTYYIRANDSDIRIVDIIKEHYYLRNTFYYQMENGKWVLDRSDYATDGREYYIRDKALFVYKDENDRMNIGMEWNINVRTIPTGITITTRKEVPMMQELPGFARTLNTIHGLILEINRLLLTNDIHTRDSYTIQGAINVINDIIDKFEIIAPGQFIIVDDYGRIHSATHSDDDWIKIDIDSNVISPNVEITHEFHKVADTTSNSSQDTPSSQGTIDLYTPKVDDKGHVVGQNIETVELPHNFKTVTTGNTNLVAQSHLGQFSINGDNTWLSIQGNADNNSLVINHIGPSTGVTTTYNTNETPLFGATFSIPTITYDSKGHISNSTTHTVKLPALSISNASSGNVLTGLSVNSSGAFSMAKTDLGSLTLNSYSKTNDSEDIASNDTLNKALNKLQNKLNTLQNNYNSLAQRVTTLESKVK